ncbi:TPA: ComF family protein [Candidatus Delongbacteria bacterium]|nr:ComF family protein [Candidatus Delongbacteria bacterium]
MISAYIKNAIKCLTDLFFPPSCMICGEYLDHEMYICQDCLKNLELHKNESKTSLSVFAYNESIKLLIHELKYNNRPEIGYILGKEMGKRLKEYLITENAVLIPVPLHKKRLRKRGYNQSEKICEGFSEVSGIKINKELLFRRINNISQTKLNALSRADNVKGIFSFSESELDKETHIILVDDLITTGATSKEASSVLKNNGFNNFFAMSVATSTK